jgi:hypothetical protein
MSIDRVNALYEADRDAEARALAVELREHAIPALEGERTGALIEPRLGLADALQGEKGDLGLALEVLAEVREPIGAEHGALVRTLPEDPAELEAWRLATESLRSRQRWYVSSCLSILLETREGELASRPERQTLAEWIPVWLDTLAFRELDPADNVLARYAVVARYYAVALGPDEVRARVEASSPPPSANVDHAARSTDAEGQIERDLAFASISPTYWAGELAGLFERKNKTLDPARAADYAKRATRARAAAEELGLANRSLGLEAREVRLVSALATDDEIALRARLREIKLENDRRVRMNAASWIAASARFQPMPQFERVVGIWREEVDYKPMWFWIAWNAALTGATDQALLVARTAARENRDDRAFVEEYQFMQRRFTAPKAAGRPRPASAPQPSPPG